MSSRQPGSSLFIRQIALPQDHGSWVFLLSPLLIGLFAGGKFSLAARFWMVSSLSCSSWRGATEPCLSSQCITNWRLDHDIFTRAILYRDFGHQ